MGMYRDLRKDTAFFLVEYLCLLHSIRNDERIRDAEEANVALLLQKNVSVLKYPADTKR